MAAQLPIDPIGSRDPRLDSIWKLRRDSVAVADSAASRVSAAALAEGQIRLLADLSEKTLTMMQGDRVVTVYQIAIGKDENPTPAGSYSIRRIIWNPRWVPPAEKWAKGKTAKEPGHPDNPMKRVKLFFREPDYYIHGTSALESLGTAASHGCLRMDPEQAAEVARYVMTHGGQPKEESWFRRVLNFRKEEKTVYLTNPVAITVTD